MATIYALCCPNTQAVRYIGKANDANARLKGHLRDANRRNTPVYCWIRKLRAEGQTPVLRVLEEADDWVEAERRHIAAARTTSRLLNVADGGDEPHCSHEVRSSNGKKVAEMRRTDPVAAKIWHAKKTLSAALKRGTLSEKAKSMMRQCAQKRPDIFGEWASV